MVASAPPPEHSADTLARPHAVRPPFLYTQSMKAYTVIHKQRGETPLEAIARWQASNPVYASLPASYAGRLDPMAEGKLLVLLGDECRKQNEYTKLDKEYEIEVVLDFSTDTGDALGLPSYEGKETHATRNSIQKALSAVSGTHRIPFPSFSSRTVNGKPLFMYALEGTLDTIQIPEHDETVFAIRMLSLEEVPAPELLKRILRVLKIVPRSDEPSKALGADFRQDIIRSGWKALFERMPERSFTVIRLRVSCSSGTYMRTLAARIAKELGTSGFALSIRRTKIGRYAKIGPIRFWRRIL